MPTYNPLSDKYLTIATVKTRNGQKDVRVILEIDTNIFYTLDDDGNFIPIAYSFTATDVFVTGGTFSAGDITFTNNTGGTFNVTGVTTGTLDYTEYVAYVTQSGASQPTAVVVKNDTGFNFTFAYSSQGSYEINATGAFTDKNKVVPSFNQQTNQGFTSILWNNVNRLDVITTDTSAVLQNDYLIGNLTIKIYN